MQIILSDFFMPCIGWWCFNLFGAILLGEGGGGAKAPNYLFPSVCLQFLCLSMASFWTPIYDHILPKLAWYITLRDRLFVIYGEGMCFSVADAENCPTHLLVHQKSPLPPSKTNDTCTFTAYPTCAVNIYQYILFFIRNWGRRWGLRVS